MDGLRNHHSAGVRRLLGGSYVAARFSGLDVNTAASIGVLLNTRGLMELVVPNLRILSPNLFAMLVVMAVVTTLATSPILKYLSRAAKCPIAAVDARCTTAADIT
jgi:Kef-type K+ transport system membrane component KefB